MSDTHKASNYSAKDIKILEGLEAVRKRPGMYIGSTNENGLHHMLWEIVDNAIDEAMAGYADKINICLTDKGTVVVQDNGRGFPVDIHPKTNKPAVETVLTVLHAGGKFDNDSYKVSGGLHGVGASVVNALSSSFKVWVWRNNIEYFIEFENGGKLKNPLVETQNKPLTNGSKVEYAPDFGIMERADLNQEIIKNRLKQLAYLNKKLFISFIDNRFQNKEESSWKFSGGIVEYVQEINADKTPLTKKIIHVEDVADVKSLVKDENGFSETYRVIVDVAFQYNNTYNSSIYSFCNNINTSEGGTHEEAFKHAVTKLLNKFLVDRKIIKSEDEKISKSDATEGMVAIISIEHSNPQYEGQTKQKLGNSEIRPLVSKTTYDVFEKYMLENPDDASLILTKVLTARNARIASMKEREFARRKSPFDTISSLPGKLADCSTKNSEISELYLVEGDSAGGSAKLGRDRIFQAILPLRGKIMNVEKKRRDKIFENEQIMSVINAIGTNVGSEFDISKLRYNKIVIMTDADVDGAHIRILLLTFFFRYVVQLVENGHIYIAQPPLYKVVVNRQTFYCYSEDELEKRKEEFSGSKIDLQRYKGLGEMNPQQLWETTMDPKIRVLNKVTIEDALVADQDFTLLMGGDVLPRKEFIQRNAKFTKNIDT